MIRRMRNEDRCIYIVFKLKYIYIYICSDVVEKKTSKAAAQAEAEPRPCHDSAQGLGFIFLKP
jgi:hypothetical protein